MAVTLSPEQASLFRQLDNTLILQSGEEARFYYRAGFYDAVWFLLDWNNGV